MPPPWNYRCTLAALVAAIVCLANYFISYWRYGHG